VFFIHKVQSVIFRNYLVSFVSINNVISSFKTATSRHQWSYYNFYIIVFAIWRYTKMYNFFVIRIISKIYGFGSWSYIKITWVLNIYRKCILNFLIKENICSVF